VSLDYWSGKDRATALVWRQWQRERISKAKQFPSATGILTDGSQAFPRNATAGSSGHTLVIFGGMEGRTLWQPSEIDPTIA
jgi:hypothetical protein